MHASPSRAQHPTLPQPAGYVGGAVLPHSLLLNGATYPPVDGTTPPPPAPPPQLEGVNFSALSTPSLPPNHDSGDANRALEVFERVMSKVMSEMTLLREGIDRTQATAEAAAKQSDANSWTLRDVKAQILSLFVDPPSQGFAGAPPGQRGGHPALTGLLAEERKEDAKHLALLRHAVAGLEGRVKEMEQALLQSQQRVAVLEEGHMELSRTADHSSKQIKLLRHMEALQGGGVPQQRRNTRHQGAPPPPSISIDTAPSSAETSLLKEVNGEADRSRPGGDSVSGLGVNASGVARQKQRGSGMGDIAKAVSTARGLELCFRTSEDHLLRIEEENRALKRHLADKAKKQRRAQRGVAEDDLLAAGGFAGDAGSRGQHSTSMLSQRSAGSQAHALSLRGRAPQSLELAERIAASIAGGRSSLAKAQAAGGAHHARFQQEAPAVQPGVVAAAPGPAGVEAGGGRVSPAVVAVPPQEVAVAVAVAAGVSGVTPSPSSRLEPRALSMSGRKSLKASGKSTGAASSSSRLTRRTKSTVELSSAPLTLDLTSTASDTDDSADPIELDDDDDDDEPVRRSMRSGHTDTSIPVIDMDTSDDSSGDDFTSGGISFTEQ